MMECQGRNGTTGTLTGEEEHEEPCGVSPLATILHAQHTELLTQLDLRLLAAEERFLTRLGGEHFLGRNSGSGEDSVYTPAMPAAAHFAHSVTSASISEHWRSHAEGSISTLGRGSEVLPSTACLRAHRASEGPAKSTGSNDDIGSGAEAHEAVSPRRSFALVDLDRADSIREHRAMEVGRSSATVGSSAEAAEGTGTRPFIQRLVRHSGFELFYGFCIVSNAIFIGIQTDYSAAYAGEDLPLGLFLFNLMYTLLFVVELALRLCSDGVCAFFLRSSQLQWNWLDAFIVASSLVEALIEVSLRFGGAEGLFESQSTSQFRILRVARITRLIRVVRITRIVRFIRALRTMVHQLTSAMKSLIWAIVLLALVIYLFAIVFTQAVSTYRTEEGAILGSSGSGMLDFTVPLLRFWSTLPRSMLTLYMCITGGLNWIEAILPLSDVSQLYVIMFVAYIILAQLAVLNVLTGVFCQNAIDSAAHDQELVTQAVLVEKQKFVSRIKDIFNKIDSDSSGAITIQEFKQHLDDDAIKAYFESLELDTTDVWALFKLLDSDEGNVIDLEEFVTGFMRLRGSAKGVDMAKLSYEHKWMAKRIAKFMKRTDDQLTRLDERLACLQIDGCWTC